MKLSTLLILVAMGALVALAWAWVEGLGAAGALGAVATAAAAGAVYARRQSGRMTAASMDAEWLARRDIARLAARASGAAAQVESDRRAEWDASHTAKPRPRLRALPDDEDTEP